MGSRSGKAGGVRKKAGRVAQLLNPVEVHEVERLLSDDSVLAQQKLDGNRVLCHIEAGEVLDVLDGLMERQGDPAGRPGHTPN
mgnify:CR=1 FL=1